MTNKRRRATNSSSNTLPLVALFIKVAITGLKVAVIGLIIFSISSLFMQFIFSYLTQSIEGPHLTIMNFAGPMLLTIVNIFVASWLMFFHTPFGKGNSLGTISKSIVTILLCILLAWQTQYIVAYYKMKANLSFMDRLTELLPMAMGIMATLFLAGTNFRRKHAS